ncbi:MAG: GCN5 family acetyltransferase [Pseudomonadota bacterium]
MDWLKRLLRRKPRAAGEECAEDRYPYAVDPNKVGTYSALTKSGGGYVWDEVLEYRVWLHPERGAPDEYNGDDYYYAFERYEDALRFSDDSVGAEEPLVLVLQKEHINEPEPGVFEHVTDQRITEWRVEWLNRSKRTPSTIPDFFAPDAPENRLAILRGETE